MNLRTRDGKPAILQIGDKAVINLRSSTVAFSRPQEGSLYFSGRNDNQLLLISGHGTLEPVSMMTLICSIAGLDYELNSETDDKCVFTLK
ncbi:MAG: hypothetical protein ACOYUZ_03620 [Patescibacteria group bacterium]